MLDRLIPQEDEDASKELAKAFGKRGIALELGKQCTAVEQSGGTLTVHFGEGESVEADLMLVSVGRAPLVSGLGLEAAGIVFDTRTGIGTDDHRRTSAPHIYAVGDCAGYWQLAHTAFREGEVAAENACGHEAVVGEPAVPRPIYTDPEIAAVGLTEAQAREVYGDEVAVGRFPWVANARAVMQNETVGFVKSIHETRYGELLGVVIVGPHATDLIEAARRRPRRRGDGRDRRRRDRAAPDPLGGDQGGGPRRARPGNPPAEPQAAHARYLTRLDRRRLAAHGGNITATSGRPRPGRPGFRPGRPPRLAARFARCVSPLSTTSTATCRRSTPSSPRSSARSSPMSSSAAMSSGARGRPRASPACARSAPRCSSSVGNCDRETFARDPSDRFAAVNAWVAGSLSGADEAFVGGWPATVELAVDGVGRTCFCHATIGSDTEIVTPRSPRAALTAALAGSDAEVVVCGHTHVQFDLDVGGTRLVNAGSVGWGYEGRPGAYWLELGPSIRHRRTEYDHEAAAASLAEVAWPGPLGPGDLLAPPSPEEAIAAFEARRAPALA